MKTYDDEVQAARLFTQHNAIPAITDSQLHAWKKVARARQAWTDAHPGIHNALNAALFTFLLASNVAAWFVVARWTGSEPPSSARFWLGAALLGLIHGWLLYNVTSVSLHEGAAHGRLVLGQTRVARLLRVLLNHACRLGFADPEYYRLRHPSHHAKLGTENDGAFTHLVRPGRVLLSLLPLAGVLPFNDYRVHAGGRYTRSRAVADGVGTLWALAGVLIVSRSATLLWAATVFVVLAPWATFTFDRLRETTDHALLPTDRPDAARSLGLGLWGWLLAPGPWGQCAHLVHHLFPALPWYHQLGLHRRVADALCAEQRKHYLIAPIVGFPALFLRTLLESRRYLDHARQNAEVQHVA